MTIPFCILCGLLVVFVIYQVASKPKFNKYFESSDLELDQVEVIEQVTFNNERYSDLSEALDTRPFTRIVPMKLAKRCSLSVSTVKAIISNKYSKL